MVKANSKKKQTASPVLNTKGRVKVTAITKCIFSLLEVNRVDTLMAGINNTNVIKLVQAKV